MAAAAARPLDIAARLAAVRDFMQLEASDSLSAANKRIANILKSADQAIADEVDAGLFRDPQESALQGELASVSTDVAPLLEARNYGEALTRMASLRQPVDAFFDGVMVMDDDLAVRGNRLALLRRLRELFLHVADFSRLQ
jgi:glycyl-tRNA synthetase beta chain